jgi:ribosome maturation factor RimP
MMNEPTHSSAQQSTSANTKAIVSQSDRIIALITPLVAPLGYEIVTVELLTHRQKTLRVFIDFADTPQAPDSDTQGEAPSIGIEDCVKVTRALDEPLDLIPEMESIFQGAYELEVSSPGVDRPLRQAKDFERFKDRQIRVHTYRPLTAGEIGNGEYAAKNPKQKNFLGILKGLNGERIALDLKDSSRGAKEKTRKGKTKSKAEANAKPQSATKTEILIPLSLVSKANLEPVFDFESSSSKAVEI